MRTRGLARLGTAALVLSAMAAGMAQTPASGPATATAPALTPVVAVTPEPAPPPAAPTTGASIEQRGKAVFAALGKAPPDAAALAEALVDIGHVELTYRKPLHKWVEGATVIDGRVYLVTTLALNRDERGAAPAAWLDKLTAPLADGLRPSVLKLALAPAPEVRAKRDAYLAAADARLRAGLRELAKEYPALNATNWGTLAEALDGRSPDGQVALWAAHYHGGTGGLKEAVPEMESFNVLVMLRPLAWPEPPGPWALHQLYPNLALMGQTHASAREPGLDAALKKLMADALVPLARLDDNPAYDDAQSRPASRPATQP